MHFKTLVTVDIPAVAEDERKDQEIQNAIAVLEQKKAEDSENLMVQIFLEELRGKTSAFARQVDDAVMEIMKPYNAAAEDPEYIAFIDRTEELKADFAEHVPCIRLAEGKIVELCSYPYHYRYIIRDGKVYQMDAGPLHHAKRTKKAKRITALPDYPRAKLYQSFADYAENCRGCDFDEEHQAYGYYCNPNAMWDWYQVGGRWPAAFLVKDTCKEYSAGERSWCNENRKYYAPEGFRWVTAARKKDIEWQEMRAWAVKEAADRFYRLEEMFYVGRMDEGYYGEITETGIVGWGEYAYRRGETVDDYLERRGIPKGWKYPYHAGDIVDAEHWVYQEQFSSQAEDGDSPTDWHAYLDEYIDNLDENTVLVSVDYHM